MPSSRSPSVMSSVLASALSTCRIRFSMRTPVCTRTTARRSGMEQLGIVLEEFLRVAVGAAGHPASYPLQVAQRQVALVLAGNAVGGGESHERLAEAGLGVFRMAREVHERDPQVLAVVEAL